MNTTTLISTGLGTSSSITMYTTDDEKVLPQKAAHIAGTTLVSTATTAVGQSLNVSGQKKIYEKYATAYVESMSDEELESALQQMDLLLAETEEETYSKTV